MRMRRVPGMVLGRSLGSEPSLLWWLRQQFSSDRAGISAGSAGTGMLSAVLRHGEARVRKLGRGPHAPRGAHGHHSRSCAVPGTGLHPDVTFFEAEPPRLLRTVMF